MSSFANYLQTKKVFIDEEIDKFFNQRKSDFAGAGYFGADAILKIKNFSKLGKSIRGALVIFSAEMLGVKDDEKIAGIAAALEIVHSSILVHDDIMDNDFTRRGEPTIFVQYLPLAKKNNFPDPLSFGKSMAISIGDAGLYLGLQMLHDGCVSCGYYDHLLRKFIKEIVLACFAQMDDVYFGSRKESPKKQDIERIYKFKTARYTFSLPLSLGAIIAGRDDRAVDKLEKLGEYIGLVFQLRDDEIGLFSDEKIIGKPVGSDIRENKKTLIRCLLFEKAKGRDLEFLQKLYTGGKVQKNDIEKLQKLVHRLKIDEEIEKTKAKYFKSAEKIIDELAVGKKYKNTLKDLLIYVNKREK